jgi:hypothetical protein
MFVKIKWNSIAMQDFEAIGEYTNAGTYGIFVGAFRFYYNNNVVGTINDSSAGIIFNKGRTKHVIDISRN